VQAARILALSALALAAPALAAGEGGVTDDLRRSVVVRTVEKVAPAVVGVYTERTVAEESPFRSPFAGDPFFEQFFGLARSDVSERRKGQLHRFTGSASF
jgi:S1-C subfamily serine protease